MDERAIGKSDPASCGFQPIDLPTDDSDLSSEVATVESSTICGSGTGVQAEATSEDKTEHLPASDDWHFLPILPVAAISDLPPLESNLLEAEYRLVPQHRKDVEKGYLLASCDAESEDVCIPSDVAEVSENVCELPVELVAESDRVETFEDRSVLFPSAADDIPPPASSDFSCWPLAAGASQPDSQIMVGEVADLPPLEEVISFPLVTSSSMFVAAVEVSQSSDQLLSLSAREPIYAHPDAACFETSEPSIARPRGEGPAEQRVPFGLRFPSQSAVEEIRQPDGSIVRRRVVRTTVRRVATRRGRRRQPDGSLVEYTETVELPAEEGDEGELVGASTGRVVGVHTDTVQPAEPQVDTDVEVVRETLPDGRVVERRIVRTRQRRTIVKRVAVRPEHPRNDPS